MMRNTATIPTSPQTTERPEGLEMSDVERTRVVVDEVMREPKTKLPKHAERIEDPGGDTGTEGEGADAVHARMIMRPGEC